MIPIIGADFVKIVLPLIEGAKKNIDIVTYDWRWYPDAPGHPVQRLNVAVVQAVRRGVIVRAVLNRPDLLAELTALGIAARCTKDSRTLHAKMILIDGKTLIIGSHNLTSNAFSHNVEASVVCDIPSGNERFSRFFENLYMI